MVLAHALVTGGAGYIGSHVTRQLLDAGWSVTVVDNLCTGFRDAVDPRATFVHLDLADASALEATLRAQVPDAVLHFAAHLTVPESVEQPLKYYLNNTANTANLLALCARLSVTKVVFSSTAAVYGNPPEGVADETSPLAPINPYGWSKLMSEQILRDVAAASPLRYVALRYFNVAGASLDGALGHRTRGATHLLRVACEAVLDKRPALTIFGTDYPTRDGTGERDYIHVEDLARAHLDALRWLEQGGGSRVFNCGYGRGVTVREILAAVERAAGRPVPVREGPRRDGDPARVVARADRIRAELGWVPRHQDLDLLCSTALDFERKLN